MAVRTFLGQPEIGKFRSSIHHGDSFFAHFGDKAAGSANFSRQKRALACQVCPPLIGQIRGINDRIIEKAPNQQRPDAAIPAIVGVWCEFLRNGI